MPKFKVTGKYEFYCEKIIEADSENDIYEKFDTGEEEFELSDAISDDYDIYDIEIIEE